MSVLKTVIHYSLSDGVPYRSGCVALLVGTILNAINQGDAMIAGVPINWIKIVLTYLVPFAVSIFCRRLSGRMSVHTSSI